MYILLWLLFGGIIGWIASILTNNNKRMGIVANIVIGILGSFLGGWIASLIGIGSFVNFSLYGIMISIGGAVLLITVINLFKSK